MRHANVLTQKDGISFGASPGDESAPFCVFHASLLLGIVPHRESNNQVDPHPRLRLSSLRLNCSLLVCSPRCDLLARACPTPRQLALLTRIPGRPDHQAFNKGFNDQDTRKEVIFPEGRSLRSTHLEEWAPQSSRHTTQEYDGRKGMNTKERNTRKALNRKERKETTGCALRGACCPLLHSFCRIPLSVLAVFSPLCYSGRYVMYWWRSLLQTGRNQR